MKFGMSLMNPGRMCLFAIMPFLALSSPLAAQDKKDGPPAPKAVTLNTKDGVILNCIYFPGTRKKKTVPIMMVHGWDGSREDMAATAAALQRLGHAIILPDLRGHGRSTTISINGVDETIDREKMRPNDIRTVNFDLQACKKFLLEQHNAGELNIELLCIVGAGESTIFAMNFAAYDWNKKQLPAYKIGRDVAALALLSPTNSFKGVTNKTAMAHPVVQRKLAIMVAAGRQDRSSYSAAKRIYNRFEKYREKKEDATERDLFLVEPDTSLSGAQLLRGRGLRVAADLAQFINLRLVRNPNIPEWELRRKPGSTE